MIKLFIFSLLLQILLFSYWLITSKEYFEYKRIILINLTIIS